MGQKQVVQEYLSGESLHGLARRHDVSCNLIRICVTKYEAGECDEDVEAADRLQECEARIAALERLVGRLTLENEFLKGASRSRRSPSIGATSVISGPVAAPSPQNAD